MVGLPDGPHRAVAVLADPLSLLAAAADQLPHPGTEVRAREHGVQHDTDEHEHEREGVQHQVGRGLESGGASAPGRSSGERASRRRIHTSAPATAT